MCLFVKALMRSCARRRLVVVRNWVMRSDGGVDGVEPIAAKRGRRRWKRHSLGVSPDCDVPQIVR